MGKTVPEGFEDLVEGQDEQLEVRFADRSAGLWSFRVDLETVTLEEPEQLLEALPLSEEAREALLPALRRPLPRNSDLACSSSALAVGCGYVSVADDTDEVQVILDEERGVIQLFVPRRWLMDEGPKSTTLHQPTAEASSALIHEQRLLFAGNQNYSNFTSQGRAVLGVSESGHLAAQWAFVSQRSHGKARQRFHFDDAYYRNDLGAQHYIQAGRLDRRNLSSNEGGNFGFSMLPLDRFDGLRVGTSQAYAVADPNAYSTPVTVLLVRNARVDAYDGDRLLRSFSLPAGVNTLDTQAFPSGSYTVDLRIHEDGILVRSEESPFTKGDAWGDRRPQWFLQGGRMVDSSYGVSPNQPAVQAGLRLPLGQHVGVAVGLADVDDASYVEGRVEAVLRRGTWQWRAQASSLYGSDGSRGESQQLTWRRRVSWNLSRQRMRGGACDGAWHVRERLGCLDSLSASMTAPVGGGTLYLGYTDRRTYYPSNPFAPPEWDLPQELPWLPDADERHEQRVRSLQASLNYGAQWHGITVSARYGAYSQHGADTHGRGVDRGVYFSLGLSRMQRQALGSHHQRASVELRQSQHSAPERTWSVGQTMLKAHDDGNRELTADVTGRDGDSWGVRVAARGEGRLGDNAITLGADRRPGGASISYSGSHSSSLALTSEGAFWGGVSGHGAGLAASVDDGADPNLRGGAAAQLNLGGGRGRTLGFGQRHFFPVSAYRSHALELHDVSSHESAVAVSVGNNETGRRLFLRPGKVIHLPIALDTTYTFIGAARDAAGVPLSGARILNAPSPALGENGGFAIEFAQRESTLYVLQNTVLLQCPLQVREARQGVLIVGQVRCQPLELEALPATISQQVWVKRLLSEIMPSADFAGVRP